MNSYSPVSAQTSRVLWKARLRSTASPVLKPQSQPQSQLGPSSSIDLEEGEITDSDEPPASVDLVSGGGNPSTFRKDATGESSTSPDRARTPHSDKTQSRQAPSHSPPGVPAQSPTSSHTGSAALERASLTPEELESAKSVVLDLLGWGVEPEYLVNYGVSPQTIRRIFTDLNLRLPRNLPSVK